MLTKQALAKRIRDARHKRGMTLKQVERLSGFSSTHISEIERGRTSPTISALHRIAEALAKDPCYFIEDRELEEVSLTPLEACGPERPNRGPVDIRSLSTGVLAGRLRLYCLRTSGAFEGRLEELCPGDICLYQIAGSARVRRGKEVYELEAGGSFHAFFETPPVLSFTNARAEMFVALDPKAFPDGGRGRADL
ncbi:MAG: helix-turn-helix domain-containing protein [Candidatus Eisenbacteria bacterium]